MSNGPRYVGRAIRPIRVRVLDTRGEGPIKSPDSRGGVMKARRRGKLAIPILFAILIGCAAPGVALASAEDWDWNFNGVLGRRAVGNKDWEPFHTYNEIGVEGSWGKADEPLMFATDFF